MRIYVLVNGIFISKLTPGEDHQKVCVGKIIRQMRHRWISVDKFRKILNILHKKCNRFDLYGCKNMLTYFFNEMPIDKNKYESFTMYW